MGKMLNQETVSGGFHCTDDNVTCFYRLFIKMQQILNGLKYA
jgi:hypothetical protein